jgi:hypothetical protein
VGRSGDGGLLLGVGLEGWVWAIVG